MKKKCLFTLSDKDTGEVLVWHEQEFCFEMESQRELMKRYLSRYIDIAYDKGINVYATFLLRDGKDSVKPRSLFDVPEIF